jgi:hypothetical protein
VATKREIKPIVGILSDPGNSELSAEEIAERVIDALDSVRSETHRYVSVLQIVSDDGPSRPYVVGPFTTYKRALEGAQLGARAQDQRDSLGLKTRFVVGLALKSANDLTEIMKPTPAPSQLDMLRKLNKDGSF